jgi:hypothetical protein
MPEHSPGCPFADGEPPPPSGSFEAAVQAAVYAFLTESAVQPGEPGPIVTISAAWRPLDEVGLDSIAEIRIGVGPLARDQMAAEHARQALSADGAPWMN